MADSRQPTFQFTCPECFVGLKASVGKVGARLSCPSCQAHVVVPEAPEVSERSGVAEKQEIYGVRQDEAASDEDAYLSVLCGVCHTRMYAGEDEIGRELTCPDCGTKTTVARSVDFLAKTEEVKPVEFDGSTEYGVHDGDYRPPGDAREANRLQIPVVCPLCHTRMHAEESQVGLTIVCPDCETETLVPEAPDRGPEPELQDVGEYGVGKPSEVVYPRFAQMLEKPLDESETRSGEERGRSTAPTPARTNPKPGESGGARIRKPPLPPAARREAARREVAQSVSSEEKPVRRRGKPPTFWQMIAFLAYPTVWARWLSLGMGAAMVAFIPLFAVGFVGEAGAGETGVLVPLGVQIAFCVTLLSGFLWVGIALPGCLVILQETAAGTDAIEEWPDFGLLLCLENAVACSSVAYCATIGYLIGQIPQAIGAPGWLGIPGGLFFFFPIVLLSLLERNSLINVFSLEIAESLLLKWWAWLLFYAQSFLLLVALLLVVTPSLWVLGSWAALIVGPWFAAIVMMYFRLLGRLAWHISGERVRDEPIEPPDLSRLIERGEGEEIC